MSVTVRARLPLFRVSEKAAGLWLCSHAPCSWQGKVDLTIRPVSVWDIEPAHSLKHWDVLAFWTRQIACRRQIPPLIVALTERGTYYIHDGNHRFEALRICYRNHLNGLSLPVAVVQPKEGYEFQLRCFATYGTYQLTKKRPQVEPQLVVYEHLNLLDANVAADM
ncbi:MAG TPA: ParB/Srx family N-terminal domain-containing protein [Terriglobales bacterium]|nr:ParB/Srx family N-terminal domain-containing protein [Terriglobales bacterium]